LTDANDNKRGLRLSWLNRRNRRRWTARSAGI